MVHGGKLSVCGYPVVSFPSIFKSGSDTHPHPLNLKRWKIQCDSKCMLCQSLRPTTAHILNGCLTDLQNGAPNEIGSPRAQTTSTIEQPSFC